MNQNNWVLASAESYYLHRVLDSVLTLLCQVRLYSPLKDKEVLLGVPNLPRNSWIASFHAGLVKTFKLSLKQCRKSTTRRSNTTWTSVQVS
jgi:hypothetical protein